MPVKLFGDWDKLPQVKTLYQRFQKAVDQALLKEGHQLRKGIVTGIANGAPGGQAFAPLSPITIALRRAKGFGGSKPLNVSGTLRGSISVLQMPGAVFIGIRRNAPGGEGRPLVNIGDIHEFGRTWTQRMTKKSRAFLFAIMRKAGLNGASVALASGDRVMKRGGRWRDAKGRFLSGQQLAEAKARAAQAKASAVPAGTPGTTTITIPARPFIRPVFDQEKDKIVGRFWENVEKGCGGDLKRMG